MRRVFNSFGRRFAAVAVMVVLASGMSAAPREERERGARDKGNPIVKVIKKLIVTLGDGLTIPRP